MIRGLLLLILVSSNICFGETCRPLYYNKCAKNKDCCTNNCVINLATGNSICLAKSSKQKECYKNFYNQCKSNDECCSNLCTSGTCVAKTSPTNFEITSTSTSETPSDENTCGLRDVKYDDTRRDETKSLREAEYGEYPWMVSFQKMINKRLVHFCSGTMIDSKFILSNAHCFQNERANYVIAVTNVVDLSDSRKKYWRIKKIIIHPGFTWSVIGLWNDIAVIKLKDAIKPLSYEKESQYPICLPTNGSRVSEGEATIVGWNYSKRRKYLKQQEITVQVTSNRFCKQKYYNITGDLVCGGGGQAVRNQCDGDSGGPLMQLGNEGMYIVGIISYGDCCSGGEFPCVFTKVSSYVSWIEKVMKSN